MARKTITQDEMRALILTEVEKAGLQDRPQSIAFLGVEEDVAGPNWQISFQGPIMFSPEAVQLRAIVDHLGSQFDIEWRALH